MLTFTRFTVDKSNKSRQLLVDGKPTTAAFLPPYPTRRGLAVWLLTQIWGDAFEWIDIGDKLACVIVRYRGDVEIAEAEQVIRAFISPTLAVEVTRDRVDAQ